MAIIIFLIVFLLFALLMLFVISSAFLGFILTRVPFVPTAKKDIELVVQKLPVSSKDIFYDLGSGDGKVVFLVEELSGARAVGFELTWWTHLLAQFKKVLKRSKARFVNKNFFKQDWSEATVIYGYLYPPLMGRVEEKFLAECKPGSRAVIRDFAFPNLKPVDVWYTGDRIAGRTAPSQPDSKWYRFKILLKSLWPTGRSPSHEIYVYQK